MLIFLGLIFPSIFQQSLYVTA